jgi:hypothetical protein
VGRRLTILFGYFADDGGEPRIVFVVEGDQEDAIRLATGLHELTGYSVAVKIAHVVIPPEQPRVFAIGLYLSDEPAVPEEMPL